MNIKDIQGIIFDMDGTLVDSEIFTEKSVRWLLDEFNLPYPDLNFKQFYGITWQRITDILQALYPTLMKVNVSLLLQDKFHEMFKSDEMIYIPGAPEFIKKIQKDFKLAIATSSNRESLDFLLNKMGIRDTLQVALSAENYTKSKPDPECYLKAAESLNLHPKHCLIFEDSIAGLTAGKNAGMYTVGITWRATDIQVMRSLADILIKDYNGLSEDFLIKIK
ncbi:MAG: HAD family phosphatase [Leptospiraceae bacterium]|nr:HAD family phosphatase [Leptospiraceae bacterium]MCP5500165.1 HAD family phosphatase [Leptospiraceae bacterium]